MTAVSYDQHLASAVDYLHVAVSDTKPLLSGAQGLRSLLTALSTGYSLDPDLVRRVSRLLFTVAPRIVDEAAGRIVPEFIYTALGCASAAMTCTEAPRRFELIAFAAILEAEVRALHLRDMITAGSQTDLVIALSSNPVIAAPRMAGLLTVH